MKKTFREIHFLIGMVFLFIIIIVSSVGFTGELPSYELENASRLFFLD